MQMKTVIAYPHDGIEWAIPVIGQRDIRIQFKRGKILRDALRAVDHAISIEKTRYYMNGVCFDNSTNEGNVRLIATDGHRLAESHPKCIVDAGGKFRAVLSTQGVKDAIRALRGLDTAPVTLLLSIYLFEHETEAGKKYTSERSRFLLHTGGAGFDLDHMAIDCVYPDTDRVKPWDKCEGNPVISFDRLDLIDTIKKLHSSERAQWGRNSEPLKRFKILLDAPENTVTAYCVLELRDEARKVIKLWTIPASLPFDLGGAGRVTLNGGYLIDALKSIRGKRVVIRLNDDGPMIICDEQSHLANDPYRNGLNVLMPMRD